MDIFWFAVIAFFWTGFFVLEGFDFGVGALHRFVGRTDTEQRVAINSIGPFWDGNEVWLIVAGAGIFAAFPDWYATMFSALYIALVVILLALIVRGVSFEWRAKTTSARSRQAFSWMMTIGSLLVPLLLGVGLGDLLAGLPIDASGEFTGDFFDLLTPYGLWTGVTLLVVSLAHGATFLDLKTSGVVRERAHRLAVLLPWAATGFLLVHVIWTNDLGGGGVIPSPLGITAVVAALAAAWAARDEHAGWAFTATAVAMASAVGALFVELYPNVMVSSTDAAYNLTVAGAASSDYALKVMTVVAVVFAPIVLIYQAWNYHVFRARIVGPSANGAGTDSESDSGDAGNDMSESTSET